MSELEKMKEEFKDTFFNDAWDEEETSIMEIKWDALLDNIISEAQSPFKEALDDIVGICVNYDGYDTVEGLKGLIDDIQDYARRARDGEIMRKSTEQAKKEERDGTM